MTNTIQALGEALAILMNKQLTDDEYQKFISLKRVFIANNTEEPNSRLLAYMYED